MPDCVAGRVPDQDVELEAAEMVLQGIFPIPEMRVGDFQEIHVSNKARA